MLWEQSCINRIVVMLSESLSIFTSCRTLFMLLKTQSSSVMAIVVWIAHEVALSVVMGECGHVVSVWARVHACWYVYACVVSSVLWVLTERAMTVAC